MKKTYKLLLTLSIMATFTASNAYTKITISNKTNKNLKITNLNETIQKNSSKTVTLPDHMIIKAKKGHSISIEDTHAPCYFKGLFNNGWYLSVVKKPLLLTQICSRLNTSNGLYAQDKITIYKTKSGYSYKIENTGSREKFNGNPKSTTYQGQGTF